MANSRLTHRAAGLEKANTTKDQLVKGMKTIEKKKKNLFTLQVKIFWGLIWICSIFTVKRTEQIEQMNA